MNRTHGLRNHPSYGSWYRMMDRCYNKKNSRYLDWGGRGIKVCKRWHDIKNFIEDMGPKPFGMYLERKDNSKGYNPSNCKWATSVENNRNKRSNIFVIIGGHRKTIKEWCIELGLKHFTVYQRIRRGSSPSEALR